MKLRSFVALFIGVLLMTHCSLAEDGIPVKQVDSMIHVSQELTGSFFHLMIDADVQLFETGTRLPTYRTNYPSSSKEAWLEVFFGDSQAEIADSFEGKSTEELLSNLVANKDRERAYSLGEKHTRYQSYFCTLAYCSTEREIVRNSSSATEGVQADGLTMTPEQARGIAQDWIERFSKKFEWKGFTWSHTYALPPNDGKYVENSKKYISTGIYLVEYERFLNGIPVARDVLPNSEVEGDVLQLYIDDSG